MPRGSRRARRLALLATVVVGAVVVSWAAWTGFVTWRAWRSIERVEFDTGAARERVNEFRATGTTAPVDAATTSTTSPFSLFPEQPLDLNVDDLDRRLFEPPPPTTTLPTTTLPTTTTLPAPPPGKKQPSLTAYLGVGRDLDGHADAIMLFINPSSGGPILLSVPRSLYVTNPCTGEPVRLALTLRGCPGVAGGNELLAIAVEDFTGIRVSGFAVIRYEGFPAIVDAIGGITVCADHARGSGGVIIIPEGCSTVDGASAMWYVTNRTQDEVIEGEWHAVQGDGDAARTGRQRQAILSIMSKASSFGSAGAIASVMNQVPGTFALGGGMSISTAANLAWSTRGSVRQLAIPVRADYTPEGAYVLYPTEPFATTLARVYP